MPDSGSSYDQGSGVLTTRLSGTVTTSDVTGWIDGLWETVGMVPTGGTFRLLFDLTGYESASIDAHQSMRNVIPQLLADHGLRPAYLDLFDDQPEMDIAPQPRVRCVALANVHHNEERMQDYQLRAGKPEQRFLSDRAEAVRWIGSTAF